MSGLLVMVIRTGKGAYQDCSQLGIQLALRNFILCTLVSPLFGTTKEHDMFGCITDTELCLSKNFR